MLALLCPSAVKLISDSLMIWSPGLSVVWVCVECNINGVGGDVLVGWVMDMDIKGKGLGADWVLPGALNFDITDLGWLLEGVLWLGLGLQVVDLRLWVGSDGRRLGLRLGLGDLRGLREGLGELREGLGELREVRVWGIGVYVWVLGREICVYFLILASPL